MSYPLDSTTFKQKVLLALLHKCPKIAVLSDILLAKTRWKKNLEQLQNLKDNSRSNVPLAVLTAHGVSCMNEQFHGLERPHFSCSPISREDYHLWSRQPQEVKPPVTARAATKIGRLPPRTAITEFPICCIGKLN